MANLKNYEVIIIGGSYAGLSSAMALGRSLRRVLVIDAGDPCNKQTPHSHNFITQDGEKPAAIAQKARAQVQAYTTVTFCKTKVTDVVREGKGFLVSTENGDTYHAQKLILATGVRDIMPDIPGFAACWGISVVHCPYCHGYEARGQKTGVLAQADAAMHYSPLIRNLTQDLTIITNGKADFTVEQRQKLAANGIQIIEKKVAAIDHTNGQLSQIVFDDHSTMVLDVLYAALPTEQKNHFAEKLGCEITDKNLIKVDAFQKTTVENVFACGDNSSPIRSVANAVAAGNLAGAGVNNSLATETF